MIRRHDAVVCFRPWETEEVPLPEFSTGAVRPCPFDLSDDAAYRAWRSVKLAQAPRASSELMVEVDDPTALTRTEVDALLTRIARCGMAIYHSHRIEADKGLPLRLGAQLGLVRLDANWLADEDGISSIEVAPVGATRAGFIPYTQRSIQWHTDGYYHPPDRPIRAMVLHCVRPAVSGGVNALLDPELAYIALRDADPEALLALYQADAMTIPAREDEDGIARAAQSGPVFSVDSRGSLHMRYTARVRSIVWKDSAPTARAVARLRELMQDPASGVLRARLEAGMGLVCNNVLHDRSDFVDDPRAPRLLYRARYLDRIDAGFTVASMPAKRMP